MKKENLLNLINDDDLGILDVKPKNSSAVTADERLISSFMEINNFFQEYEREPLGGGELKEHQLAARLKNLRSDKIKKELLLDYDEFNLFNNEVVEIKSMKDIFNDDDLGILDKDENSLFEYKNVPSRIDRSKPDYIARRRPCVDFEKYQLGFIGCQKELRNGHLRLEKLKNHKEIKEGLYFVLSGILGLVVKISEITINDQGKINGRLYLVFENGTESNMLLQSLIKSLQEEDGWLVYERMQESSLDVGEEDIQSGYIYIVKSLSSDPRISSISNLYKIGFSTTPVEERVKNAEKDPTYLFAPVKIISVFECYNLNPQKMEILLHGFFGSACLNIDVFDVAGKRVVPREWFIVPLEIIEQTVNLIMSGGIINYNYDSKSQQIILK